MASSTRPARGKLVIYRHPDPITGQVLEGPGVVIGSADEGGVWVRPLADHDLFVDPDNLTAVSTGDLAGEPDPAVQD